MICIYHYKTEQHPSSSTEDFANEAFVLIKDVTGSDAIKFLTIEKNKRSQEEAIDVIKKADANDYVIIDNIGSLGTYHLYSLKEQENNNKKSVGRPVVQYPVGWEQCYAKWKNKEISSKTFMEQMGLKKATFYNLLTEYKSEKNI